MARIVDPLSAELPVPRQGGGISRLSAAGPNDATGRAVMQLGLDIGAGADEIYKHQKLEEDRLNTLRAEDAFTKLRARQTDMTWGEDGFTKVRGEAAVTRPIRQDYTRRFDQAQSELAQGLANDQQKTRFRQRASLARNQFDEEILRHLGKESDTYAKQVYDGAIAQSIGDATARWDSPADVGSSIARVNFQVRERAERYDWPNEYRDAVLKEELGKIHASVIGQALASNDSHYAKVWYDAHKDEVNLPTAKLLEKALEDGAQKEMTANFNAQFLADRDNRKGLERLAQTVVASPLDETRKNIVHGRILGRIETLDLRAEREKLQQERQVGKLITDANANTFAGMPSTIEQLAPIVEASKGTALEPEARQMVAIANATAGFARMTPLQQADAITQAEATVRQDPAKFDRRILTAWKEIHGQQQELLAKDPNTFAERQGIVDPSPVDLANPTQAADALQQRFSQTRALSAKYGSPNRPLKETEAKIVSRVLEDTGWKEKRDYLGELFQASRGDLQGYSGILSQIAKDHPVTAVAGEYAAKGRGQASELMLAGEALLRPSKKTDGKPDGSSIVPMPPEPDMRREFDASVRDAYAGRPELRNVMYQATRAIYAKLASDKGVKDTKNLEGDLWEQALKLATGGVERYNGRSIPMPYAMDKSTFSDQVKRRTEDMQAAGALPAGLSAAQLQDLPLEPIGDGRYTFRTGTGILVAPAGVDKSSWAQRADGSTKGTGFLGLLQRPDGKGVSSEISIGVNIGGKEVEIPTMVPGLSKDELNTLLTMDIGHDKMPKSIVDKAVTHAKARIAAGKSPFASDSESPPSQAPMRPIILDFNQSTAYRPSGYGQGSPIPMSDEERWRQQTGGQIPPRLTQEQAIERWKRGERK